MAITPKEQTRDRCSADKQELKAKASALAEERERALNTQDKQLLQWLQDGRSPRGTGAIVCTATPAEPHECYMTETKSMKPNEWQHTQKA